MRHAISFAAVALVVASCRQSWADGPAVGDWVTGTVRGEDGEPLSAARVFVTTLNYDGHGLRRRLAAGTSNKAGRYTVSGEVGPLGDTGMLFACTPGFVAQMSFFDVPERPHTHRTDNFSDTAPWPTPVHDFVMTRNGGNLNVVALIDGKPVAGASVQLERPEFNRIADGVQTYGLPEWQAERPVNAEFAHAIHPFATSDKDGVARFSCLTPGAWDLTVAASYGVLIEKLNKNGISNPPGEGSRWASAVSVPVRSGKVTTQRVNLHSQPNYTSMRALDVDGRPLPNLKRFPSLSTESGEFWNAASLDVNGVWAVGFQSPGIHRLEAEPAEAEVDRDAHGTVRKARPIDPVPTPPESDPAVWNSTTDVRGRPRTYVAAVEELAVSSLIHLDVPPAFTVRPVHPGVIDFCVLGIDGRPSRQPVTLDLYQDSVYGQTKFTDATGHARFSVASPHRWLAFMRPTDGKRDRCIVDDFPPPPDEALEGRYFFPAVRATSRADTESAVSMHAARSSYVRGRVKCLGGSSPEDYTVYPAGEEGGPQRVLYDRRTGDFLAGPFAHGRVELAVVAGPYESSRPVMRLRADVPDAGVVHLGDIVPPTANGGHLRPSLDEDKFRVLMNGGKTPATFARAMAFQPGDDTPRIDLLADAAGNVNLEGDDHFWGRGSLGRKLVVSVPGTTGAAIVDLAQRPDKPWSVVLPKPVSATGHVTVARTTTAGLNGQLRVLAGHLGGGELDRALSVWATPQNDGTFELSGLTPGHYLVQAALDGVWLSDAVPVDVADHGLSGLALDIGQPGGPVAISVVDGGGKPVIGRQVKVDRPIGPLTDLYWPADFFTDGAGVVNVPPLEAGKHRVRIEQTSIEVTAQPLPCKAPAQARCVVSGARPRP